MNTLINWKHKELHFSIVDLAKIQHICRNRIEIPGDSALRLNESVIYYNITFYFEKDYSVKWDFEDKKERDKAFNWITKRFFFTH